MTALEYALLAALVVAAAMLGRYTVDDFRRGVVHYSVWTYSRTERRLVFWFLSIFQFVILAVVIVAASAILIGSLLKGGS